MINSACKECLPEVKAWMIDAVLCGHGIRDTAGTLAISSGTTIDELRKRSS